MGYGRGGAETHGFSYFFELYKLVAVRRIRKDRQAYVDLSLLLYDSCSRGLHSLYLERTQHHRHRAGLICLDTNAHRKPATASSVDAVFNLLTIVGADAMKLEWNGATDSDEAYLTIDQKVPQSLVYLQTL